MEKSNNGNIIICHIVGLNSQDKKNLKNLCSQVKNYILVDLDAINNKILQSEEMTRMYNEYSKYKNTKNDIFKDIDKKMTKYWEDNMLTNVFNFTDNKKKIILIGISHHYRITTRKINFKVANKFFVDNDINIETKNLIKYNLEKHKENIINGSFPIEFIDFKVQHKKKTQIQQNYLKSGYTKLKMQKILEILELHAKNKIEGKGLWLSLHDSYNIGSEIHPISGPIDAYIDPILSLICSFNLDSSNINFTVENKMINFNEIDTNFFKKLKKARYLYYVCKNNFIPSENEGQYKYSTQDSVIVLEKEEIKNVYDKFKSLNLFQD